MERSIACVKWKERPYAVVRYTDSKPGLVFGIIKAVDCQTKWGRYTSEKAKLVQSVIVRLEQSFNRNGSLKFLGNYNQCLSRFSELMFIYSSGNYFHEPVDTQDSLPYIFNNKTVNTTI